MTPDLFDDPGQAGFGSNVHEVASEGECRVLRLDDSKGEGFMTMYRVFEGIYLMYNDFHLRRCESHYRNEDAVLCIDHCREGRIEHENLQGGRYYMEAGDLRIDKSVQHEGRVELPLSHYHGISIGFLHDSAQKSLKREMPFLKTDPEALAQKFCPDQKEFLLRSNESVNAVFSQLYAVPRRIRLDYFRVKIAELLLLLSDIDTAAFAGSLQYFPASQTEKVKELHSIITGRLDKSYTVEELSRISGMPSASLRKVFKAVYGAPVYQYVKRYKMKAAAELLISENNLNIAEIAQRLGYDNASKFSSAFRDIMGVTPQHYRNRQEDL